MRGVREGRKTLAATLAALLLFVLPLESRGLRAWAERLEVGDARTVALAASAHLATLAEQTPLPRARSALLAALAAPPAHETTAPAAAPAAESVALRQTPIQRITLTTPAAAGLRPVTVALVGDSMMAVGLGPYLTRELSAMPGVRVVRAWRSGTGLARPEVFDWRAQYPKLLGSAHPDLVICAIGANDAQNFLLDGKPVAFGDETWNREYQRRVAGLLETVAPGDTPVLWLALPSMRSEKFARRVLRLNGVVKQALARERRTVWLESNPLLGGGAVDYVEFQKNRQQKLERLRQDDGIHLSDAGAARIGPAIVAWVAEQRAHAPPQGSSMRAGL